MQRKIVCPVPDDKSSTILSPTSGRPDRKETTERYFELRTHLQTFGTLLLERTSGTFRKVTPSSGLLRLPPEEMQKAYENERSRREKKLFSSIPGSDCFIAPIDSGIDHVLAQAVELALVHRIPVLLLQQDVPLEIASRDRFRNHPGTVYARFMTDQLDPALLEVMRPAPITYAVYRTDAQMRLIVTRFMNRVPLKSAQTG